MSDHDEKLDPNLEKTYATLKERELYMKFNELFVKIEQACQELENHPSKSFKYAYKYAANTFRKLMNKARDDVDQIKYIRVD